MTKTTIMLRGTDDKPVQFVVSLQDGEAVKAFALVGLVYCRTNEDGTVYGIIGRQIGRTKSTTFRVPVARVATMLVDATTIQFELSGDAPLKVDGLNWFPTDGDKSEREAETQAAYLRHVLAFHTGNDN